MSIYVPLNTVTPEHFDGLPDTSSHWAPSAPPTPLCLLFVIKPRLSFTPGIWAFVYISLIFLIPPCQTLLQPGHSQIPIWEFPISGITKEGQNFFSEGAQAQPAWSLALKQHTHHSPGPPFTPAHLGLLS